MRLRFHTRALAVAAAAGTALATTPPSLGLLAKTAPRSRPASASTPKTTPAKSPPVEEAALGDLTLASLYGQASKLFPLSVAGGRYETDGSWTLFIKGRDRAALIAALSSHPVMRAIISRAGSPKVRVQAVPKSEGELRARMLELLNASNRGEIPFSFSAMELQVETGLVLVFLNRPISASVAFAFQQANPDVIFEDTSAARETLRPASTTSGGR